MDLQLSTITSAIKPINCPLMRFDVFVMIYCRILCQLDTISKQCLLWHIAPRCFEEKNQNIEYDPMSEGYLGQYLQAKSSNHYKAPKETTAAIQTAEIFLSIPESNSHPKAWQIIITLCSILPFSMKLSIKRPGAGGKPRATLMVVAKSHITWICTRPAWIICPAHPCGGGEQQIRRFPCSEGRMKGRK